jgi:hypothetical protein
MTIPKEHLGILTLAAAVSLSVFVYNGHRIAGDFGLPLDDSWIHMVFAKNLAEGHYFFYNEGEPVSGSTSPLWTTVVAMGSRLAGNVLVAGLMLGVLFFYFGVLITYEIAFTLLSNRRAALCAGLITAFSPRLIWGALSGMEVSLYVALVLLGVLFHLRFVHQEGYKQYLGAALLVLPGMVRPGGFLMFFAALTDRYLLAGRRARGGTKRYVFQNLGTYLGLFALLTLPYFLVNVGHSGFLFPTTYLAKVGGKGLASAILDLNISQVITALLIYPMRTIADLAAFVIHENPGFLVLVPLGLVAIACTFKSTSSANRSLVIPIIVLAVPLVRASFTADFSLDFQWGRRVPFLPPLLAVTAVYAIYSRAAAIPGAANNLLPSWWNRRVTVSCLVIAGLLLLFKEPLFAIGGSLYERGVHVRSFDENVELIEQTYDTFLIVLVFLSCAPVLFRSCMGLQRWIGRSNRLQAALAAALIFAFCGLAYNASFTFGRNVKNINELSVTLGKWAKGNLPANSLVAISDIGAFKYFSHLRVLDLHGIVTPEILPYRKAGEREIFEFLRSKKPDYLAIYPEKVPWISSRLDLLTEVHSIEIRDNITCAGNRITVLKAFWP